MPKLRKHFKHSVGPSFRSWLVLFAEVGPQLGLTWPSAPTAPRPKMTFCAIDSYRHWVETGLAACERLLPRGESRFCFGDQPTLADACLVPQFYNARRLNCDLAQMPRLVAIDATARTVPAFAKTAPEAQPDAP